MLKTIEAMTLYGSCLTMFMFVVVLPRKSMGGVEVVLQMSSKPGRKQPGPMPNG